MPRKKKIVTPVVTRRAYGQGTSMASDPALPFDYKDVLHEIGGAAKAMKADFLAVYGYVDGHDMRRLVGHEIEQMGLLIQNEIDVETRLQREKLRGR